MIVYPNAKINLGLFVTEKRSDGYHNIESLFYPIGLTDKLEIELSDKFNFSQNGIQLDSDTDSNLVVKAFRLMQKKYTLPEVSIHLEKRIPFGGGLGGGSADASYCLIVLNQIFQLNLTNDELKQLSESIGADCPFFIDNKPAIVSGIGNIIRPYKVNLKGYNLVLVKPEINISTPMAYQHVKPKKPANSLNSILSQPVKKWQNYLINDFETSVFKFFPQLNDIKQALYDLGADYASMSGSGATMYGLFKMKPDMEKAFNKDFVYTELL